jgi:hypothetical protein
MIFEFKTCRAACAGDANRKAANAASKSDSSLPASRSMLYPKPTDLSPRAL